MMVCAGYRACIEPCDLISSNPYFVSPLRAVRNFGLQVCLFFINLKKQQLKVENQTPYPRIDQTFGILGMYLVFTAAVGLPVLIVFELSGYKNDSLMNFTGYTVAGVLLLWWAILRKRKYEGNGRILRFGRVNPVLYPVLVMATLAFSVALDPLANLIPLPEFMKELFAMLGKPDVFTFLVVVVSGPILEELLFRGIILSGFLKRFSPWKAIFLSSLFFGVFHLNPWQFIPAVLVGMLIGYVFWKTGSLLPCIFIHWINNFAGWLMAARTHSEDMSLNEMFGNDRLYYAVFACSLVVLPVSIILLRKVLNGKPVAENS